MFVRIAYSDLNSRQQQASTPSRKPTPAELAERQQMEPDRVM